MKAICLDFDKLNDILAQLEVEGEKDRVEFEKFLYTFCQGEETLTIDDILNLNKEYIDRFLYILDKMSLTFTNIDLKNNNDYLALVDLYKFSYVAQNFRNVNSSGVIQNAPKSLMFY